MKLAFSTLGCPEWSLSAVLEKGKAYGFDGVDFRGIGSEIVVPNAPEFTADLEDSLERIRASGLQVYCLSSSTQCVPKDKEAFQFSMNELQLYLELAEKMEVPFVRIFGGPGREGASLEDRIRMGSKVLKAMGDMAGERSVQLVMETHDAWCRSEDVRALLKAADHPCVGVCWDIHHPYAINRESPSETWSNLFPFIWHVHIKDAKIVGDGQHQLCLVGEGELPIRECLKVLEENGYEGSYVFEWEKRWHQEIEEADVAFPKYVDAMKAWASELGLP